MSEAEPLSHSSVTIPKRIFIVPYRNRVQHKFFFCKYMSFILEDKDDYEILFTHQCDARTFNRGAIKNIGFLAARAKYPQHYRDITFIFNDVDTIPFTKIFDYETTHGVVKHYYGFEYALGGIVVMKGADFERTNGFPCFWGWGMEDNVLQKRCDAIGLKTDRSVFYKIGSPEILQLFDGISRIISKKDPWRGEYDDGMDGLQTIRDLRYTVDDKSDNPNDNIFVMHNPRIKVVNVKTFLTRIPFGAEEYYNYDLREPKRKIINPDKIKETKKTIVNTTDWSNIPYYPTTRERRENVAKYLTQMGRPVPPALLQKIHDDQQREMQEDAFNSHLLPPSPPLPEENRTFRPSFPQQVHTAHVAPPSYVGHVAPPSYVGPPSHVAPPSHVGPPHRYSPQYAAYVGAKPRAQASAKVRLGGVF